MKAISGLSYVARPHRRTAAVLASLLIVSMPMRGDGADVKRFDCTILSDQQKGGLITFDAGSKLLLWKSPEPTKMILRIEKDEPSKFKR